MEHDMDDDEDQTMVVCPPVAKWQWLNLPMAAAAFLAGIARVTALTLEAVHDDLLAHWNYTHQQRGFHESISRDLEALPVTDRQ